MHRLRAVGNKRLTLSLEFVTTVNVSLGMTTFCISVHGLYFQVGSPLQLPASESPGRHQMMFRVGVLLQMWETGTEFLALSFVLGQINCCQDLMKEPENRNVHVYTLYLSNT